MRKIVALCLVLSFIGLEACSHGPMTLQQRMKKQAKRKKRNPDDCPQIDCD